MALQLRTEHKKEARSNIRDGRTTILEERTDNKIMLVTGRLIVSNKHTPAKLFSSHQDGPVDVIERNKIAKPKDDGHDDEQPLSRVSVITSGPPKNRSASSPC